MSEDLDRCARPNCGHTKAEHDPPGMCSRCGCSRFVSRAEWAEEAAVHAALTDDDRSVLLRLLPLDRGIWRSAARVLLLNGASRRRAELEQLERALVRLAASAPRSP